MELPIHFPGWLPLGVQGMRFLVVGGSRGLGLAIAEGLAAADSEVWCLARTVADETRDGIHYLRADVASEGGFSDAIGQLRSGPRLDGLVFASGISIADNSEIVQSERFVRTLETNLTGAFRTVDALAPLLKDKSSIVLLSSINAYFGFPGNPGYVASKAGLCGLGRSLAVDLAPRQIRVNSLVLGYFPTDMTRASASDPRRRKLRSDRTLLQRWGRIDEAVWPAMFLLSPFSSYVTGQDLVVDGGWSIRGI